jgi:hypothetical protein
MRIFQERPGNEGARWMWWRNLIGSERNMGIGLHIESGYPVVFIPWMNTTKTIFCIWIELPKLPRMSLEDRERCASSWPACLEGGFAIEFASCGADVIAVEGQKRNLAKLDFATAALQLSNIQTFLSDVRKISVDGYGIFDCVLCLGILYHIDKDSIGDFLKNIYQMTSRVLILDTHVSLYGGEKVWINGVSYFGATYTEHQETDSPGEIESRNWASLDNKSSFFLTFGSLMNLLKQIGFTSVYTCEIPYYYIMTDRRPADYRCHKWGTSCTQVSWS